MEGNNNKNINTTNLINKILNDLSNNNLNENELFDDIINLSRYNIMYSDLESNIIKFYSNKYQLDENLITENLDKIIKYTNILDYLLNHFYLLNLYFFQNLNNLSNLDINNNNIVIIYNYNNIPLFNNNYYNMNFSYDNLNLILFIFNSIKKYYSYNFIYDNNYSQNVYINLSNICNFIKNLNIIIIRTINYFNLNKNKFDMLNSNLDILENPSKKINNIIEKINELDEKIINFDKRKNELNEKINELDKKQNKISKELNNSTKKSIEILAIFVSIFTLISTNVNFLNSNNKSISLLLMINGTVLLSIQFLFNIIYKNKENNDNNMENSNNNIKNYESKKTLIYNNLNYIIPFLFIFISLIFELKKNIIYLIFHFLVI